MKVHLNLSQYNETFNIPSHVAFSKMRLLNASVYNNDMVLDEPIFINIVGYENNYDANNKRFYNFVLHPHATESWFVMSRDLDTWDWLADNNNIYLNHIEIQIFFGGVHQYGSLGLNKMNLEIELS